MRLIKSLLLNIDTRYLLTREDDVERWSRTLEYKNHLDQRFDTVMQKKPLQGIFHDDTTSSNTTDEFLVSTTFRNISQLPMGLSWEQWEQSNVHPVNILNNTGDQPPVDLIGDHIKQPEPPLITVISIDMVVLILQWIAYVREMGEEYIEHPDGFIHHYVIRPLHDQLLDLWILEILRGLTRNPSPDNVEDEFERHRTSWIPENAMLDGMKDAAALIRNLQGRRIDVGDITSTPFFSNGKTIEDKIDLWRNRYNIPDDRRYRYLEFLAEYPLAFLILNMYMQHSGSAATQNVVKKLRKALRRYKRQNLESLAHGRRAKDYLSYVLEDLELRIL